RLHLHSMPGRLEDWGAFVQQAEAAHIDHIVCLASFAEIEEKSPGYAKAIQDKQLNWNKIDYPIQDFGVPTDRARFLDFVDSLAKRLTNGDTVLIHCAAGIGRTGTVATCVLQALGTERHEAIRLVKKAGSMPETESQEQLVAWHAEKCRQV
ncbi:MAG: dual specificity protein phosphatase family protein, partial [Chloroflexota bacterium]